MTHSKIKLIINGDCKIRSSDILKSGTKSWKF